MKHLEHTSAHSQICPVAVGWDPQNLTRSWLPSSPPYTLQNTTITYCQEGYSPLKEYLLVRINLPALWFKVYLQSLQETLVCQVPSAVGCQISEIILNPCLSKASKLTLQKAQTKEPNSDLTWTPTGVRGGLHKQKSNQNQAWCVEYAAVAMADSLLFITCAVRA